MNKEIIEGIHLIGGQVKHEDAQDQERPAQGVLDKKQAEDEKHEHDDSKIKGAAAHALTSPVMIHLANLFGVGWVGVGEGVWVIGNEVSFATFGVWRVE